MYEFVALNYAAHTTTWRFSASPVANGYQCKQRQINWFCCLKLPETKFILITALCGDYIQMKNRN